jgi:HK97 family phage prohead protease
MRLELSAPIQVDAATAGETEGRRTISGVAAPYGVTAHASTGMVRFQPGSLPVDGPAPKLIRDHNLAEPIGLVTARVATDDGVMFEARISRTAAGDEALTLAADGVLDAVSVGVQVLSHEWDGDVLVVHQADWQELSLVPFGAFPQARVLEVAATQAVDAMPQAGAVPDPTPTPDPDPEPSPVEDPDNLEETPMAEATTPTAPLVIGATPRRVTAAQYLSAVIRGENPPRVEAVAAEDTTADIQGLLPEPLIGEVFNNLSLADAGPVLTALGTRAMPAAGETFYRRKITTHVSVAEQVAQFDELSSTAMVVDRITCQKATFGGYVDLAEQTGWSDPALLGLILEDMARVTRQTFNQYVCGELVGGMGTATATITDFTDGDEVIEDLYLGAAEMRNQFGAMPTHLLVSTDVWAQLGAAKDSGGNRIFPYLGPSNAAGTAAGVTSPTMNPLGLTLVVDDALVVAPATSAAILLNARAIEVYEDVRGGIRVDQPATLSTRLAFRAFGAVADIDLTNGALSLI